MLAWCEYVKGMNSYEKKLHKALSVLALCDIKLVNPELMSLLHLSHWTIQPRSLLMELRKAEAFPQEVMGITAMSSRKPQWKQFHGAEQLVSVLTLSVYPSPALQVFFSDKLTFMATVTNQKLAMNDILLVRWRTYFFSFHSFIICSCSSIIYYCFFWENVSALT